MPKINKRKKKEEKLVLESQKTSQRKTLVISAISIGVLLVLAGIIAPVALKVKYSGTFDVIQLSLLSVTEPNDTYEVSMKIVGGEIKLDYIDLYISDSQEIVLRSCWGQELMENDIFNWCFENSDEYQITDGITIHFVMFMGDQWITLSV
ncbi:MAG: hypothetical protein ACTSO7_06920 [Candidatus Heimdallarchaeota archaeon]